MEHELDRETLRKLIERMDENGGVIAPPSYFTQVPDNFNRRPDLTMQEKLVFTYIWGYCSNKGHAFPSQARMLKELATTKPTLNKILRSLEEKNGIYIINQYTDETMTEKTVNLYYISEVDLYTGEFKTEGLDLIKAMYPDKIRILPKKR